MHLKTVKKVTDRFTHSFPVTSFAALTNISSVGEQKILINFKVGFESPFARFVLRARVYHRDGSVDLEFRKYQRHSMVP